jgi:uncharacterized protein YggE
VRLVIAAALALAASLAGGVASAQSIDINIAPGEVVMKVEAEGIHYSRPDVMTVSAGVVTTGRTAREALRSNAALATRLIDAVRASGVEPSEIRTQELSVKPTLDEGDRSRAESEGRRPNITGYVATNRVRIQLNDLNRAPDIIDAMTGAGANDVRGPSFSLSNPAPAVREARRAAVAAALVEANTYAEALNMRIVRVLRVSERGDPDEEEGEDIVVTGSRIPRTPIEPGEIATTVNVWIDYAMVPR